MKTKRLAVIFLSLITAISLTTQTFADVVDPNARADDGGTVAGASTLPGYDNTYDYGYRVSVVDESGKSLGAADLVDSRINGITDNWGSSTGTDKASSGQLVDQRSLPSDMPAPLTFTGSSFEGQGNAVKNYLTQKNGDGVENVVKIAQASFDGVYSGDELVKDLQSGKKQLIVEPILSLPSYTDEPIGTTRTTSDGKQLHVVQVTNPASGRVYKYWANADGTEYTYTGTIREFVQEELGPYGSIKNNFVGGVIKQTLKSFMFNEEAFGLQSLSEEQIDDMIEKICENPALLDELAAGAFAFSNKQAAPPPQQPQSTTSTGNIDITESRITRHKKLSDVDTTLINKEFEWEVPAFTNKACSTSCHCGEKDITDPSNTLYIDEMNKPGQTEGVVKDYLWTAIDDNTNKKDYTRSTWDNDTIKLSGVEYSITVVRLKDNINIPTYRKTGNESAIVGLLDCVSEDNQSTGRLNTPQTSFDINLLFKDDGKGEYKTTSSHTDYKNTTPKATLKNPNPKHTHRSSEKTSTATTEPLTKLQMTLHINQYNYAGTKNTSSSTQAAGLTQHPNYGKQETWLELNYGTVEFVPYIKMQYDSPTTQGAEVYVAGKYLRSFTANEHVGVIFNTSKNTGHSIVNTNFGGVKGKISLQSNQWSTHAKAVKNAGSNCVLPGGAVLDLAILKENRQTFTVESIKPILVGSGLKQVNATKTNIIELQCVY